MGLLDFFNFFRSTPTPPQEVELKVFGQDISRLDKQSIIYRFGEGGQEVTCELRTGREGMVHHLFEKKRDADKFLEFIRKFKTQFPDITKARITDPSSHPDYKGESFSRIRISPAQFKFLAEACGQLTSPKLAIPPTQKSR